MTGEFAVGAHLKKRGRPKAAHTIAAEAAGLSPHQTKQALRVASIPTREFERLIESAEAPTVTELASLGLQYRPASARSAAHNRPLSANLLPVFNIAEPERLCRLRELRMAAMLLLGGRHSLVAAVTAAIADPDALVTALDELDALPAIPRRRLLATLVSVLP